MPSTYSTSLKLQLIGTGEQAGVWGTTTNYNLGTLVEQAITGVVTLNMGDANYTMTNYNGLSDEARNAVLVLNGPITSPQNLIAPSGQQKVYIVRNFTGNTVTIRTSTGNGVSLTNAASAVVFTDGTDFYSATTLNYIDGNLTVTGTTQLQDSVTMATKANATVTINANDVYGNASTGQWYTPIGTTGQRTANPINGLIRYNTTQQIYEGYANGSWVRFQVYPQGIYTITYSVIAGGGGGGNSAGGGGGAGGVLGGSITATATTTYTFTIGAGGSASTAGTNSFITGVITATGGGVGGATSTTGGTGGSGGGGGGAQESQTTPGSGGAGISGQGNNGAGGGSGGDANNGAGGGGGGFGGNGSGGGPQNGGAGGAGGIITITGTSVTIAGGGGGGAYGGNSGGAGGSGGGGTGGSSFGAGSAGTVNTGSGGGAGATYGAAAAGGSGVIYISMPTVNYTGQTTGSPVVTTYGSTTVLKYTSSGTYTA